jgi:hypothetical protein
MAKGCPCKVLFNNNGEVFYVEQLNTGLFYIPEGEEIDHIDLTNPTEPVAIMKGDGSVPIVPPLPFITSEMMESMMNGEAPDEAVEDDTEEKEE